MIYWLLRSNILVVFNRFSTCCFQSTSNSRSPDFSFFNSFRKTYNWLNTFFNDRSAMVRFSSCDFTTKKRGMFKSVGVVGCWVSDSESEDSYDSPADCLRFFTLFCDIFLCLWDPIMKMECFNNYALHPPWSGRYTEMDLLFPTPKLHYCHTRRSRFQRISKLLMIYRWQISNRVLG